ncbi:MAG: class I SAM-dependent methyltransferase [Acidobacteria bacterium]|nr:class I SAM-dependent methyltransferase [Acidobacteriota bacterium]
MPKGTGGKKANKANTQGLYDRIADVHNLAMKVNGYQHSVAKYIRSLDLKLDKDSLVLDAGSGTGIITLGFHDSGLRVKRVIDLDLSFKSIAVSREEISKKKRYSKRTDSVQADVLRMPFADETFDLVLTCGVLEYTPLDDGLREAARVLKKGAPLVFVPVKPSIVGSVLELLYNFKIHPLASVRTAAKKYFRILGNHEFPITEPISWSKTIFLLEKI